MEHLADRCGVFLQILVELLLLLLKLVLNELLSQLLHGPALAFGLLLLDFNPLFFEHEFVEFIVNFYSLLAITSRGDI